MTFLYSCSVRISVTVWNTSDQIIIQICYATTYIQEAILICSLSKLVYAKHEKLYHIKVYSKHF